ncbi:hypothetical protein SGRIM119S_07389 [Streptomyces griseorubiginosus]
MRSSSYFAMPTRALLPARTLLVLALTAIAVPTAHAADAPATNAADTHAVTPTTPAAKPYMGWSSWSMQSSKYPGLNPDGDYSYLTEANVLKQTDALAAKLKKYGYEYVNIDAGWWMDKTWKSGFDGYGRQKPDPVRFPSGMKAVADRIHAKGLKAGIYLPAGLEKGAYGDGKTPVWNAGGCTTGDIVYDDLRTTNGWDSAYKLDFAKPCTSKYIDSQARLIADWGYDFLKLDGVGPGSGKSGDQYDNVADVAAWHRAIADTGRPIHLELSWSLDIGHAADWKKYSQGWRVDTDVECYCNTLVSWENSVDDRWDDTPAWTRHAGPGGWNDLDSLDVGNGQMDGLTKAERQSYATLWAIAKSPLYTGDDLTRLDPYGLSLLHQPRGHRPEPGPQPAGPPGHPVRPPAGLGVEEPRRHLHRRPVQPRRRPRRRHRRLDRPRLHRQGVRPRPVEPREPRHLPEQGHPGPARPRLPPLHGHPARHRPHVHRLRGRVRREHPRRQRLRRRLLRLLERKEGGQLVPRRQADLQRRDGRQGRHLPDQDLLHQR